MIEIPCSSPMSEGALGMDTSPPNFYNDLKTLLKSAGEVFYMKNFFLTTTMLLSFIPSFSSADDAFKQDAFTTHDGEMILTFIGHGTLILNLGGKIVHVDPWSNLADYTGLPGADLVLVTHEHRDHLDPTAISQIRGKETVILANHAAAQIIEGSQVIENGQTRTAHGLKITAVPAYNVVHKRPDNTPYHPKGVGNGYIIEFGRTRIYIAGDTENIPEMGDLGQVDIAFIPVNLPYTMNLEMAAQAARTIRPKVLYPYHLGDTDIGKLKEILKKEPGMEVRIRPMQ